MTAEDEADEEKVILEVNLATSRLRSKLRQVVGASGSKYPRLYDMLGPLSGSTSTDDFPCHEP